MRYLNPILSLTATVPLLCLGLLSEVSAADEGQTNVTVEVVIFSGRPNPTWPLKNKQPLETLKTKFKDLPEAYKEQPTGWPRLGFRGFRIRGGEALGLPGEIWVYQGVIKTGQGKAAKFLKDSIGLERSLVAESKQQALEPAVKDAIAGHERKMKGGQ